MIFETHAHYDDPAFDSDREQLLSDFPKLGIGHLINVGTTITSSEASLSLAHRYPYIYAAVGLFPCDTAGCGDSEEERLAEMARDPKTVAIGEIGLDNHYKPAPEEKTIQREWFLRQLALARRENLPVIIHSRDAAEETFSILKEAASLGTRGVIHCYSYSAEQAEAYARMGYDFGIGGVLTFSNAKKLCRVVEKIPLSHLLLETDSPYLAPSPFRGMRNDSGYLPYVIGRISSIKGIPQSEVIRTTEENALRLFDRIRR